MGEISEHITHVEAVVKSAQPTGKIATNALHMRTKVEGAFDDYDAFARHPWYQQMIVDTICMVPELPEGSHIVVAGCGTGVDIEQIQKRFGNNMHITGIDLCQNMLAVAERKFQGNPMISLCEGDARKLSEYAANANAIVAPNMIHYMDDKGKRAFANEAAKVLPSGGALVACTGFFKGSKSLNADRFLRKLGEELLLAVRRDHEESYLSVLQAMRRRDPDPEGYAAILREAAFDVGYGIMTQVIPFDSTKAFYTSSEALSAMLPGVPRAEARAMSEKALDAARSAVPDEDATNRQWLYLKGTKL